MSPLPDALITSLARGVERGQPELATLEALGEPEPARAGSALVAAARHPDLKANAGTWLPLLLSSARPGFAAEGLVQLAGRTRAQTGRVLDPRALPGLGRVIGSSAFLARLLQRHPGWADDLVRDPPDPPETRAPELDWGAIRIAKYRGLLRVAARDLASRPFERSLGELSGLADGCLGAGLACAARERDIEPPALFALGKLGGRELNFSSDVDLLFLYQVAAGEDELDRSHRVSDLIRTFKSRLEERTEDGFGYRVDLDLRPEGRSGALVNSVEAALAYYESFGAAWERQMLIRLRPIAGPVAARDAFVREITPFVYRSLVDPGAIGAVREIKTRIESERHRSGVDLEADLKEGPGGIRDVEFLVQSLQLIQGGREPALRTGNVLDALTALRAARSLQAPVAASLRGAYLWLRRAEHALQLDEERQTHAFPREARAQIELARRMGYADGEARVARDRLLDDWTNLRAEVRRHFEDLVLRPSDGSVGAS